MATRKKSGVPRGTTPRRKTSKKTKAGKHPGGRPSKYRPEYCADLIEHFRQGGSIQGFGGYLYEKYVKGKTDQNGNPVNPMDICPSEQTVYAWFDAYPEFLEAKKIGLPLARQFFDELTRRGVAGALRRVSKEEYGPNGEVKNREYAQATFGQSFAIFAYKNRFGWRDRVEHSGEIGSGADKSTGKTLDVFLKDPKTAAAALKIAEAMAGSSKEDEGSS